MTKRLQRTYADFQETASQLRRKRLIARKAESGGLYTGDWSYGSGATRPERQAVKTFLELQSKIQLMAMLLLELEHAVDQENKNELPT